MSTGNLSNAPGVAHSSKELSSNKLISTSWGVLDSVILNVPAAGYVLIFASSALRSDHDLNDYTYACLCVSKTSDGTAVKEIASWHISSSMSSAYYYELVSAQVPVNVTSAGPTTFYLMGYRTGGDGQDAVYMGWCNLTALYVPVAYGTVE